MPREGTETVYFVCDYAIPVVPFGNKMPREGTETVLPVLLLRLLSIWK